MNFFVLVCTLSPSGGTLVILFRSLYPHLPRNSVGPTMVDSTGDRNFAQGFSPTSDPIDDFDDLTHQGSDLNFLHHVIEKILMMPPTSLLHIRVLEAGIDNCHDLICLPDQNIYALRLNSGTANLLRYFIAYPC